MRARYLAVEDIVTLAAVLAAGRLYAGWRLPRSSGVPFGRGVTCISVELLDFFREVTSLLTLVCILLNTYFP